MINVNFDSAELRALIREEMRAAINDLDWQVRPLPPMLTRNELKQLLRISNTKASELLGREDFPVLREAGVLIPTHLFMKWVEEHTEWVEQNVKPFRSIG